MNNDKKVTVITLTYNKFEKLYDTIRSVLSQDYINIEYLISDDASVSFPEKEIKDFIKNNNKTQNVKILHNYINLGTVKNANLAYKAATGDYIINLACGDIFFSDHVVSQIVERFQSTRADVIATSRILYVDYYKPVCLLPHYLEREIIQSWDTNIEQYKAFVLSMFYDAASGSAMAFTKNVMELYGYFDEQYILWEDGPFIAKYLWDKKILFAHDIISIWYETGGVSDKSKKKINQKLLKDDYYFSNNEKLLHLDVFTRRERRLISYRNEMLYAKGKIRKSIVHLKYIPQTIAYYIYAIKRLRYKKGDYLVLNSLLKNKANII